MNKIRVCAFLALVVFIGSVVTVMLLGFMDGWNEAGARRTFQALPSVSPWVRRDATLPVVSLLIPQQAKTTFCIHMGVRSPSI